MMNSIWKLFTVLCACTIFTACVFDQGGLPDDDTRPTVPNPPGVFDPTTPFACEAHSDCDDGSNCTINRCMDGVCKVYDNEELDCECIVDSDCNDDLSCTTDKCSADGVCSYESECEGSDTCHPEYDVCAPDGAACTENEHCDDDDTSTDDYCTDYVCENLPNGTVCGNGVCEVGEDSTSCLADCPEPECTENSECDDGDTTTDDYCTLGACENLPNGTVCGDATCDASEDSTSCPADCTTDPPHTVDCKWDASMSEIKVTVTGPLSTGMVGGFADDPGSVEITGAWNGYSLPAVGTLYKNWDTDNGPYVYNVPVGVGMDDFTVVVRDLDGAGCPGGGAYCWADITADLWTVTGDCVLVHHPTDGHWISVN